jgi:hypothetical protein
MSNAPLPNLHDLTAATTIPPGLLTRTEADLSSFLERAAPIIEAVRRDGDAALLRLPANSTRSRRRPWSLRASEESTGAPPEIEPAVRRAIDYAIGNIRRFHEAQKPEEMWLKEIRPGAFAGIACGPSILSPACPARQGSFSVVAMTTIRGGRGRAAHHRHHSHPARRAGRYRNAGRARLVGIERSQMRRGTRHRRRGLWHRDRAALRQGGGARQPWSWRPSASSTVIDPARPRAQRMPHPRR